MKYTVVDENLIIVYTDEYPQGYGVVSKARDPQNAFNFDEVLAYTISHPQDSKDLISYEPSEKELLQEEKAEIETWLRDHDYIGVKIATGRATVSDYATEIAEMTIKANRIDVIKTQLANVNE